MLPHAARAPLPPRLTRPARLVNARAPQVKISQICSELNVDGIRGDIVTNRAAKAIAAFEGRSEVAVEDIYRVIPLCLRHRLRKDPLADIDSGDKVREVFKSVFGLE
jgi:magnesium chelatase subunit I